MKRVLEMLLMVLVLYSCRKTENSALQNGTNPPTQVTDSSSHNNNTDSTNNNHDSTTNTNCRDSLASHWTFKGMNYCAVNTVNDTVDFGVVRDVLKSTDGISDSVSINFWSDPMVTSTFIVNNGSLPTPQPGTCTILVHHGDGLYVSTGFDSGGIVHVVVSANAITASFSNVPVRKNDTSYAMEAISGVLIKR